MDVEAHGPAVGADFALTRSSRGCGWDPLAGGAELGPSAPGTDGDRFCNQSVDASDIH